MEKLAKDIIREWKGNKNDIVTESEEKLTKASTILKKSHLEQQEAKEAMALLLIVQVQLKALSRVGSADREEIEWLGLTDNIDRNHCHNDSEIEGVFYLALTAIELGVAGVSFIYHKGNQLLKINHARNIKSRARKKYKVALNILLSQKES